MQLFSFGMATILAVAGIGTGVFGIVVTEWKPTAIGLVLLLGAGVFATLNIGTRMKLRKPD